ncbi:ankyrin repeat domain-containing protein 26 isoform X5 [Pogoniulus pusillus]|uniref:ankyrin repeat domain-containing protein 26 isoform X5 n=1 Tax=Pogoniulus pusillus TaxID=488313 RepID=UPI0030B93FBB
MKRIFGFGKKKKEQPPTGSAPQPSPTGAYDLHLKDLGKLHRAAASGDLAQVRRGLKKYGIDGRDKAERTPLHLACANGHVDVVAYLVENKCKLDLFDRDKRSPLMKAVQCQQEKCVAILLENGADPNLADADGNTALHLAVISPNISVSELLLQHDANIDAQNKEGCTPLILAISEHQEEVVDFLLRKGADVHARDECKRTPLMTAASGGEPNLIKVLLQYGADVSQKDANGWTAEEYALIHGHSSLSKQLAQHTDWENAEASADVHSTPRRVGVANLTLGAPTVDRGMQQPLNQTSREAIDDLSQGDSISSEKVGSDDSWLTSEEENLDSTPKKLQKPNLKLLMNASQQFRKNSSEVTDQKKEIPQPFSDSCGLKDKKSSFGNGLESDNSSLSAAKNPGLEIRKSNSIVLEREDDEDTKEQQCEERNRNVCEVLIQESENLHLTNHEENLRAALHSRTKERSPEQEEKEEQQQKKQASEELQTTVVEGVKNSTRNDSHQVHSAAKDNPDGPPSEGSEEEEDSQSPWDSEPDCGSLRKVTSGVFLPATDIDGKYAQIIAGECSNDLLKKPNNSQLKDPEPVLEMNETSPKKGHQKSDGPPSEGSEEEEDSQSPWDSEPDCGSLRKVTSGVFLPATDIDGKYAQIIAGECSNDLLKKPNNSQLKDPEPVLEMNETSPKKGHQKSDECLGSSFCVSSPEKEDIKDTIENCGVQDKYILETTNLIEKTTHENHTNKAEISHQEENEELHSSDKWLSPNHWEERYEKMWVENEKKELKTNFKNITAELKLLFGEINETGKTSLAKEMSEDGFSEVLKSSHLAPSHTTESSNKLESKGECGDTKLMLDRKVPEMEMVTASHVLHDKNNLNTNVEDAWSIDENDGTNSTDNTKVPLGKGEEKKMPAVKMEENESGSCRYTEGSPEYSLRHSLKTSILDGISNNLLKTRPVSTSNENAFLVTERKLGKYPGFNGDIPSDCLINSNKLGKTEMESLFANAQQSCGMLKRNLDEELNQDIERFKSKVGMLQMVFLALEKEKVQLQKEVEKEKSKETCFKTQELPKQEDLNKLDTPSGNITNQQVMQKLTVRNNDHLKMENENTMAEKGKKCLSSEERSTLIKMPTKGTFSLNAKDAKKNKRRTSKQKANQHMNSSSGNTSEVLDDSTSTETSQDEGRPAAKTRRAKNKASMQMDVSDDDLDSTHSSDTTSEDVKLTTPNYKKAALLLEQLRVHLLGSTVSQIQDVLLEYEQMIKREKKGYRTVCRELRKLESEKESLQLIVNKTQDLAQLEMKWKNDIQSLKLTLEEQEEKRLTAETLYERTREKLRRKEDQYCKEMEEKQQLELHSRNLEIELITVKKLLKEAEEECDETQRQLSQEKSARALQEGILNNHLWRQKELEEETRRTIRKNSEEFDSEREKDLLYKNHLLQDEIAMLRLELDQVRLRHQEEKGKYVEENETLKEKNEDLKQKLKLNKEALAQTVFQYDGQLDLVKTESAMLTSELEKAKENKDRLETEIESFRARLNSAVQELERYQLFQSGAEQKFQKDRDEWLRLKDKLHHDVSDMQKDKKSLSQQLSKAESKANSLENELHQLKQTLGEKTLLLEMTQKELNQAQCQAKECDHALQLEKDQVSKFIIKQESMKERLAQLQSENLLLRQQLEDMQNKGIIKEKVVNDVQERFNDIFNKLRADTEKQVYLVEERNKELNAKYTDLREQIFKYETDKVEREGMVRQLQQELADALKKQSMSEASLEVTTRYRSDLEEDKLHLQKELEKVKTKLQELEEQHLQSEHCVHDLKTELDDKERELIASSQKLQDLLLASSGTTTTIKQLEEHVQRLEIENARLEATVQQQSTRIEALQRDLQVSASVHKRLEDLITGFQTTQAAIENHHQQQIQKQNVVSMASKDSVWEEQLRSIAQLEKRVAQLDREKADLLEQCERERRKVKKLEELKHPVEMHLDQEIKRNVELQENCKRLKRLLNRAVRKLRLYEEREMESQLNLQGEMKNRSSKLINEVGELRAKVGELSQQLEIKSKKCVQLEVQNQDLQEELSTVRGNHEKLEKSKCQLKEEVADLKHRLETSMSQMEEYKRAADERADQEIRHKIQEVNLVLQTQAAFQDQTEQIRASHHATLRNQLNQRIKHLERELDRIKSTQQDSIFQKESMQAEVEKYKELYLEEIKIRGRLANKLERANEKLAEASAKLLQEQHRSKSLFASSFASGDLGASPVLYSTELGHLGNNLALNRSLSLGASFLSPARITLSSRKSVEAFVAKVRQEMDEKVTKELERVTAELETGSAGASPTGSADRSPKNFCVDQDPLNKVIQEYRDVLTKNYMI